MAYATTRGQPKPLGATVDDDGVNFSIFSQHASGVDLLLFDAPDDVEPAHVFNPNKVLIDPYGRGNLRKLWVESSAIDTSDNVASSMRSLVADDRDYDWEGDAAPNTPLSDFQSYLARATRMGP